MRPFLLWKLHTKFIVLSWKCIINRVIFFPVFFSLTHTKKKKIRWAGTLKKKKLGEIKWFRYFRPPDNLAGAVEKICSNGSYFNYSLGESISFQSVSECLCVFFLPIHLKLTLMLRENPIGPFHSHSPLTSSFLLLTHLISHRHR